MFSIFHFFADLGIKREHFLIEGTKLEEFPFDEMMLSLRQSGKFPDMAIRVNDEFSDNPLLMGGELLELKDSQSYVVSSFNSTIPSGTKDINSLGKSVQKMKAKDDNTGKIALRQVYYLVRGHHKGKVKVCLVHGSFFETVDVNTLIASAFRMALEEAEAETTTQVSMSDEEKEKLIQMMSRQDIFSSVRKIENASVSLRFRIMTEARKEANILKFDEIKDNTLNLIVPVHGEVEDTSNTSEISNISNAMSVAGTPDGALEPFLLKHPFNGYFWVLQVPLNG